LHHQSPQRSFNMSFLKLDRIQKIERAIIKKNVRQGLYTSKINLRIVSLCLLRAAYRILEHSKYLPWVDLMYARGNVAVSRRKLAEEYKLRVHYGRSIVFRSDSILVPFNKALAHTLIECDVTNASESLFARKKRKHMLTNQLTTSTTTK